MSRIRADQILNGAGTGAPNFSLGLQVGAATTIHTTGIDLGSGNIQSHNINSTGIITATSGTFSGNVSVGGTLTYEDVTSIDSVGVITAKSGIHVTGGNVGIGTDDPNANAKLHVIGGLGIYAGNTTNDAVVRILNDGSESYLESTYTGGAGYKPLVLKTGGNDRLTITAAGLIGINKSSPSSDAQLDVVGSSYWPILVKTTSTGGGGVAIKDKDDTTSLYTGTGGSAWLTGSAITDGLIRSTNNLLFATGGNNERLRITSAGITSVTGSLAINGNDYPTSGQLSNRNLFINGAMQVAQRGTTSTVEGYGTVDRIMVEYGQAQVSQAQLALTSGDPYEEGFRYAHRAQVTTASSASNAYTQFRSRLEAQNIAQSGWNYGNANKSLVTSFWARSSVAGTFYTQYRAIDVTGGQPNHFNRAFTLSANTWKKVTHTLPGHSGLVFNNDNGNGLEFVIVPYYGTLYSGSNATTNSWFALSGDYFPDYLQNFSNTQNATFDVTGIQIEQGYKSTPFEHRSISEDLLRCQRYFIRQDWVLCNNLSNIAYRWVPPGPSVNMRAAPAMSYFNPSTGTANQTYEHSSATARTINSSPAAISSSSGTTTYFGTSTNGTYAQYVRVFMNAEL